MKTEYLHVGMNRKDEKNKIRRYAGFAAVEAATQKLAKPHIQRGLEIMSAYKGLNNNLGDLEGISTVIQVGHTKG